MIGFGVRILEMFWFWICCLVFEGCVEGCVEDVMLSCCCDIVVQNVDVNLCLYTFFSFFFLDVSLRSPAKVSQSLSISSAHTRHCLRSLRGFMHCIQAVEELSNVETKIGLAYMLLLKVVSEAPAITLPLLI